MTARPSIALFLLVLTSYGLFSLRAANARPLTHDEVYTLSLSRFSSPSQLWDWLRSGTDLNPPLNYFFARLGCDLAGPARVGVRLPSILAYGTAILAVYLYLRRRHDSELAGWIGGLTLLACNLPYYAVIARAYALMVMWGAVALLLRHLAHTATTARTRALSGIGLGLVVSASLYTHYYGILLLLPLTLGELVCWWQTRRIHWAVVVPVFIAAATALGLLPLVQSHRGFSSGFWGLPQWATIEQCYHGLLTNFATPFFASVAAYFLVRPTETRSAPDRSGDDATLIGYLLIPAVGVALGVLVTHAFDKRYVVVGYLGAVGLFAGLLAPRLKSSVKGSAFILVVLLGWWILQTELRYRNNRVEANEVMEVSEVARGFLDSGHDVVVIDSDTFLTTAVLAPDVGRRLIFPADGERPRHYDRTDTIDRNLLQLRKVDPSFNVQAFSAVVPTLDTIVIGDFWQKTAWEETGYRFTLVRTVGAKIPVYRVSALPPKTRP